MAAAGPLLRLPPELILRISTHLTTPELGFFRRISKQIEGYLFDSFAREFFTKRQFMVEQPSLDALIGIANHKSLAPFLQEVIISTDGYHGQQPAPTWRSEYLARNALLALGSACDMLAEAFSHLPNLRVVGLRDYDGRGRERDGENALWRSYGWTLALTDDPSKALDRLGSQRTPLARHEPGTLLTLLLHALGKANARPLNIEVFLRRMNIPDSAFHTTPQLMQKTVVPVISGLKTLLLALNDLDATHDVYSNPSLDLDFTNLKHFLRQTPHLEHLRLNFASSAYLFRTSHLLDWLGSVTANSNEPLIELKHLTTLELGMVAIPPSVLVQIVTRRTKLTSLALWKVALYTPSGDDMAGLWPQFLPKLAKAFALPESVRSLTIGFAGVHTDLLTAIRPHADVKFAGKVRTDANGKTIYEQDQDRVSYRKQHGSSVREWLEQLAPMAHVPLVDPSNFVVSDDSSDTSDSDIEDEEDEEEVLLEDESSSEEDA